MFAARAAVPSGGGGGHHQQDGRQCTVPAALLARGAGRFNRRTENVDTMFDNMEELVGNTPSEKNWKALAIALVVIASILALITISVAIVEPKLFARPEVQHGQPLTFTESMTWMRYLRQLNYQWLRCHDSDTLLYRNTTTGDLMTVTLNTLNDSIRSDVFLPQDKFSEGRIDQFTVSPDCTTVLLPTRVLRGYRHSSQAHYKLVRLPLKPPGDVNEITVCPELDCQSASEPVRLQLAVWGPVGSFIAFVYQNNIFYADNPFNMAPVKITETSGNPAITYGIADWVYEEEILETNIALWVSPGNQRIAYLRFNDSSIRSYDMPWYGSPDNLFLQRHSIRYPKAGEVGEPIANVTALVYDVKTTRTVALTRPEAVPEEHHIAMVRWLNADRLLVAWLDRSQEVGYLTVCRMPLGVCSLIYSEHRPGGWSEMLMKQTKTEPIADSDGPGVFIVLHNSGHRRIALLKTDGLQELQWVTPATYDVADILHVNSRRRQVFFLSCRGETNACDPTRMHVQRISVAGADRHAVANCLTCSRLAQEAANCDYNKAAFSPSGGHFLQECLGPDPYQYFLRQNDYAAGYPITLSLERNENFKALLATRRMPRTVFKRLLLRNETTDKARADPLEVHVKLLLPEQLNESHITQYPLLYKIYGGPVVQLVTRRFDFGWAHYIGSALNFITASVDARGTGNRGSDFLFAIKNNFAKAELEDHMDAVKLLRELQFVNSSAMALFGWSYGGFLALHMLGHPFNVNNSYVSSAAAVAAVTDFSYYNSGYTERYLGVKSDKSAEAYRRTNVAHLADNFWNKDLFLAHGTGDDNVHYQNSAQLVKTLVQKNIDFDFMTYPDDSHNLWNSQIHLYQQITTFLVNAFNHTSERRRVLRGRNHNFCPPNVGQC